MDVYIFRVVFVVSVIFGYSFSRIPPTGIKDKDGEERGERDIVKRDATFSEGQSATERTVVGGLQAGHPASEPLDPRISASDITARKETVFRDFETSHSVFQPEIEERTEYMEGKEEVQSEKDTQEQTTSDMIETTTQTTGFMDEDLDISTTEATSTGSEYLDSSDLYASSQSRSHYVSSTVDSADKYSDTLDHQNGDNSSFDSQSRQTGQLPTRVSGSQYQRNSRDDSTPYWSSQGGSQYYVSSPTGSGYESGSSHGGSGYVQRPSRTGTRYVPTRTGSQYDYQSRAYSGSSRSGQYFPRRQYIPSAGSSYSSGRNYNSGGSQNIPTSGAGYSLPSGYGSSTGYYGAGAGSYPSYDTTYSGISSDPTCPSFQRRILINGMPCITAIETIGDFVCYNYERVSRECCERCLSIKQPSNSNCEYGDRSNQCRNIKPFDCYVPRNREICCETCRVYREQRGAGSQAGCEYGDLTPRCQLIIHRPHLCYLPENQRLCCITCPRLSDQSQPDCRWGNQNPELCKAFDFQGRLQLNCYQPIAREVCCATCKSLRERIRDVIPGCEYGDSPVQFSTGRGVLDCATYLREYGLENCQNPDVARHCCHTCYRYREG